jgi:hypothetical protein
MAAKKESTPRFKTYTKKIGDTEYTAQFSGLSMKFDMADYSVAFKDGKQFTSNKLLAEYLLNNVIVDPNNLTIDDFENEDELTEVLEFATKVVEGKDPNFQEQE